MEETLMQTAAATPAATLQNAYHRVKWGLILRGLLGIAIGVLIIVRPMDSIAVLALVIAIWALVDGIAQVVRGFDLRNVIKHSWVLILTGIIGIVFGVAALYYYPVVSLAFMVVWVAFWLITTGALTIYASVVEKRLGLSWGWTLAWGLFAVIVGIAAAMQPRATLAGLMALLAAFGLVGGIAMLVGAAKLHRAQEQVEERMRRSA
jgi:uncharacterized membrane protein HdeD (DUF308 family)